MVGKGLGGDLGFAVEVLPTEQARAGVRRDVGQQDFLDGAVLAVAVQAVQALQQHEQDFLGLVGVQVAESFYWDAAVAPAIVVVEESAAAEVSIPAGFETIDARAQGETQLIFLRHVILG